MYCQLLLPGFKGESVVNIQLLGLLINIIEHCLDTNRGRHKCKYNVVHTDTYTSCESYTNTLSWRLNCAHLITILSFPSFSLKCILFAAIKWKHYTGVSSRTSPLSVLFSPPMYTTWNNHTQDTPAVISPRRLPIFKNTEDNQLLTISNGKSQYIQGCVLMLYLWWHLNAGIFTK